MPLRLPRSRIHQRPKGSRNISACLRETVLPSRMMSEMASRPLTRRFWVSARRSGADSGLVMSREPPKEVEIPTPERTDDMIVGVILDVGIGLSKEMRVWVGTA